MKQTIEQVIQSITNGEIAVIKSSEIVKQSLPTYERLQTLVGHARGVHALTVLPTGDRLASAADDGVIKLWDARTGACVHTRSGAGAVRALAVLPDNRLVSGSYRHIKIWNAETGVCERTLGGHTGSVYALAVLKNGYLASSSTSIKLWDVETGACKQTIKGHTGNVYALVVLPDSRLASCSSDKTVKVWNAETGACEQTLSGHLSAVHTLVVLPNGHLASGSQDGTIKVWNLETGACEQTLSGHTARVCALAVLPDGRLVSGSAGYTIKLWNIHAGICEQTFQGGSKDHWVDALIILPDDPTYGPYAGQLVSSSGNDKSIHVWSTTPILTPICYTDILPILDALITKAHMSTSAIRLSTLDLRGLSLPPEGYVKLKILLESLGQVDELHLDECGLGIEQVHSLQEIKNQRAYTPLLKSVTPSSLSLSRPVSQTSVSSDTTELATYQKPTVLTFSEEIDSSNSPSPQSSSSESSIKTPVTSNSALSRSRDSSSSKRRESVDISTGVTIATKNEIQRVGEKDLGQGGFGSVYRATWRRMDVAVKELKIEMLLGDDKILEFKKEAEAMARLRSPYIVSLYAIIIEPYGLIMEYMAGGTLKALLYNIKDQALLPWARRKELAHDVIKGLTFLHDCHIVHRDLKSENVLLDSRGQAKLSDFGLSRPTESAEESTKTAQDVGTTQWMAPELFEDDPQYTEKSDIYSYGMVLWEIASCKQPFLGIDPRTVPVKVMRGQRETIPENTPEQFTYLIKTCWAQSPDERPTAEQLLGYMEEKVQASNFTAELVEASAGNSVPQQDDGGDGYIMQSRKGTPKTSSVETDGYLPADDAHILSLSNAKKQPEQYKGYHGTFMSPSKPANDKSLAASQVDDEGYSTTSSTGFRTKSSFS